MSRPMTRSMYDQNRHQQQQQQQQPKDFFNNIKTNHLPNAENKIKQKLKDMPAILSDTQLKNLNNHKYSCVGNTLLDPLFQPFWGWLVEKIPMYIAPNLLTITGLIINILTSTILMLYSPNADKQVN